MEKDSKTTVAVERTTFAKLDRLAKANSVSKMEFITHAINYFEKYGINPVEHESPAQEMQPHGFLQGFHGDGFPLDVLVSEEVGRGSGCKHEVVVFDFPDGGLEDVFLGENQPGFCHAVVHVRVFPEYFPEREGDGTRFDACGCHLVDERWELVIIVLVNQDDLKV